jgi:hypothetical protein
MLALKGGIPSIYIQKLHESVSSNRMSFVVCMCINAVLHHFDAIVMRGLWIISATSIYLYVGVL